MLKLRRTQRLAVIGAVVLPAFLINVIFLLSGAAPAHASACGPQYYFAHVYDQDNGGLQRGLSTTITNTNTWQFNNALDNSHQMWQAWLAHFPNTGGQGGWSLAGIGKGKIDTQTISDRSIIFEWTLNDPGFGGVANLLYISGHPINDGDYGYYETWLYMGGNGHIWTRMQVSSSSAGTWSTDQDFGSSTVPQYGTGEVTIETAYIFPWACNVYVQYSTSNNQRYTTAFGVEPVTSGSSWNSCTTASDSPYNVQLTTPPPGTCSGTAQFWGG